MAADNYETAPRMTIDLHTHTTASDGRLEPQALIDEAMASGVSMLAITDHDSVAAYAKLDTLVHDALRLIPGIELSTTWRGVGVHVLGLNVDLNSDSLHQACAFQTHARASRAQQIAERLERLGANDVLAGAARMAQGGAIGRPHFARYLVEIGFVKNHSEAFRKFLGSGKAGDVKQHWASFAQIIEWIRASNGIAVLAHPAKYGLTRSKRNTLIGEFAGLGGQALEIISGQQEASLTQTLADTAAHYQLQASCGSDFHQKGQPWAKLGMPLQLPAGCRPIWRSWA